MAPASLVSKDKQLSHWTISDPLMQGPSTQRVQAHVTCIWIILLHYMESLVISAVSYYIEHWTIKSTHRCKRLILDIFLKGFTNEAKQSIIQPLKKLKKNMLQSYRRHIKNTEFGIVTAVRFQEFNSLHIRSHQHFSSSWNISATGHAKTKLYILDSQGSQKMTPADIGEYMSFPLVQGSHWLPKTETENRAKSQQLLGCIVRMQNVI